MRWKAAAAKPGGAGRGKMLAISLHLLSPSSFAVLSRWERQPRRRWLASGRRTPSPIVPCPLTSPFTSKSLLASSASHWGTSGLWHTTAPSLEAPLGGRAVRVPIVTSGRGWGYPLHCAVNRLSCVGELQSPPRSDDTHCFHTGCCRGVQSPQSCASGCSDRAAFC